MVEKAETTEKTMLLSPILKFENHMPIIAKKIIKIDIKNKAIALYVVDLLILCSKIVFSSLFLMTQKTVAKRIIMVEIFIPPEVPVGFAPINIKMHKKSFVKLLISDRLTEAKPDVLAAVELKTELEIFSKMLKFFKVVLYSKKKNPTVPKINRNTDPKIAILEFMEMRFSLIFAFLNCKISFIVTNPMPPRKVNALIVKMTT